MQFYIHLSPVYTEQANLTLSKHGATLLINGDTYDFGFLEDGDICPFTAINSIWVSGNVTRTGDTITLTLRLPHGANASEALRFPEPILVEQDGPVTLPIDFEAEPLQIPAIPTQEPSNAN